MTFSSWGTHHRASNPLWFEELDNTCFSRSRSPRQRLRAVGNPQQLGQKPITYNRQVLSLCTAPFLLDHPKVTELYPQDAIDRARDIMKNVASIGAYSDSRGVASIRQEVADFIERRDGCALLTLLEQSSRLSCLQGISNHLFPM